MGRSSYDVTFDTSRSKKKRSPRSSGMDLSEELPTSKKIKNRRNDKEFEKDDDDEDCDDVSDECSEDVLQNRNSRACLRAHLIQKRFSMFWILRLLFYVCVYV